tara:strand:- start:1539 stop:2144 length:606 start_codon:yes stop_codon:yes gene_type:complete
MNRKKRLRLYQIFFLIIGLSIIIFTYSKKQVSNQNTIISKSLQKKIDRQLEKKIPDNSNVFYNVKYSGLDLEGNRYTISAEEAINSDINSSVVKMSGVKANFYFKDNTLLTISSNEGDYNNKTLDMEFRRGVKAFYETTNLYAEKAEFLNSKNSLIVSDNVKIKDPKGTMFADKLIFDIKSKTLNITSLNDNMINSTINYK